MHVPRWDSLGLNQDVSIGGIQHSFTNELLSHRDRLVHGHAEVGEVIQEPNGKEGMQDLEHRASRGSHNSSSHRRVLHSFLRLGTVKTWMTVSTRNLDMADGKKKEKIIE